MMPSLFYPPLQRQNVSAYQKSEGLFYETYNCKTNYTNVAKDCLNRCVYCDAHIDECGGEPFSLDHFRPKDIFGSKFDGILNIHPFNLHLSCQKCNVLKTNDWKGCTETQDGPTFRLKKGYIDRFKKNITDYLEVDNDGRVRCNNPDGPADYMIGKLLLNRTNRVYIRKLREVRWKAQKVREMILLRQQKAIQNWTNGDLTEEQAKKEITFLTDLFTRFASIKSV